jgi:hypothetical protein
VIDGRDGTGENNNKYCCYCYLGQNIIRQRVSGIIFVILRKKETLAKQKLLVITQRISSAENLLVQKNVLI